VAQKQVRDALRIGAVAGSEHLLCDRERDPDGFRARRAEIGGSA